MTDNTTSDDSSRIDTPTGPLDVATLDSLGERAVTHHLVVSRSFQPDAISPRVLSLGLDDSQYPRDVHAARLDVRWFESGDYTVHYLESRGVDEWQCRWDRHPKPEAPHTHYHPPPDASAAVEPSPIDATYHLGVLFAVLDWVGERIADLHSD